MKGITFLFIYKSYSSYSNFLLKKKKTVLSELGFAYLKMYLIPSKNLKVKHFDLYGNPNQVTYESS